MKQIEPGILTGEQADPPQADNDNLRVLSEWMTPAEVLQWVRREKVRLCREVASDPRLWFCPEHRRTWNARLGIEAIVIRQYYGGRRI